MNDSTVIVESQPDWITATHQAVETWSDWVTLGDRLLWEEQGAGGERKAWGIHDYRGSRCGRVAVAFRVDSHIIALSGDLARRELGNVVPLAKHVSRLDVAVTWRPRDADDAIEARLYVESFNRGGGCGRPVKRTLLQASDGGATLYLGSRCSDRFGRVYNKAVESGDPHYVGCHRAEVELKGDVGDRVARLLLDQVDRASWVQAYVHDYLAGHGLTPPFPTSGCQVLVPGFRRRSDADTRLAWVETQVAPTVDWLMRTGHQARLEAALGLSFALAGPSVGGRPAV